jgi:ketosteroid isomerase-like protein
VTETGGEQTTSRYQYMLLWRLQADGTWKVSRGTMLTVPEA